MPRKYLASANGFYSTLLDVHTFWDDTLGCAQTCPVACSCRRTCACTALELWIQCHRAEGMMDLSLPPIAATNGTWLHSQSIHAIVRSMISRDDTWHPRYGVLPGYGSPPPPPPLPPSPPLPPPIINHPPISNHPSVTTQPPTHPPSPRHFSAGRISGHVHLNRRGRP